MEVYEGLEEVKSSLAEVAGRLDISLLLVHEAEAVVAATSVIVNIASTLRSEAAARMAEGQSGRPSDDPAKVGRQEREAAERAAKLAGTSPSKAKSDVEQGKRLKKQKRVSKAAKAGELSPEKTAAISEAVEVNPSAEASLLELAASGASLAEVRSACAQAMKDADKDPEETRRKIHAARDLHSWTDSKGVWHLRGEGLPEFGAPIDSALAAYAERSWQRAKEEAKANAEANGKGAAPEPLGAYRFDALVALVAAGYEAHEETAPSAEDSPPDEGAPGADEPPPEGDSADPSRSRSRGEMGGPSPSSRRASASRRGPPFALIVRVDYTALLRGSVAPGETSELVGYGPIDIESLRHLCAGGDPFVSAVVTHARKVIGVANFGRRPNALQATALAWLYPTCAALGCPRSAHLQADHREDWA
ncbi:MAG: hypothetical protein ACRDYC_06910, partial [Acidimicrobiales bacterium]